MHFNSDSDDDNDDDDDDDDDDLLSPSSKFRRPNEVSLAFTS
jgi:hypothetical protein